MTEVSAKAPKVSKEATIIVDLGEDVDDAIARFGKDVVFSNYLANVKIGVQSGIRRYLEAGKTQDEVQAAFATYKPGATLDRVVDPLASLAKKMESMSAEEQEDIFAKLREKLGK